MSTDGDNGSIADRPSNDGTPQETILAGAPDGAPYADESSSGKDMGNAAAIAGYSDGGARGATPDVEGFASGATGSKDEVGSTAGNGAGNTSTSISGADPSRTIDQSSAVSGGSPGAEILEDDAEADQGGFKGA